MDEQNRVEYTAYDVVKIVASVLLSRLVFGIFIFPIPLLFVVLRLSSTFKSVLISIATSLVIIIWNLLSGNTGVYLFMNIIFIQICLTVTVYTAIKFKSRSILRKIVLSSVPSYIIAIAFILFFSFSPLAERVLSDATNQLLQTFITMREFLGISVPEEVSNTVSPNSVFIIFSIFISVWAQIISGFSILASEFAIGRRNSELESDFAFMKMPPHFIYIFFSAWILFVLSQVLARFSTYVQLILLSLCIWITLHYLVNGISLGIYQIRRIKPNMTAYSFLIILFLLMFVPFLNLLILIILISLAIIERFVKFRKNYY